MVKSQELVSVQPRLLKALSTHLQGQTGVEVGDDRTAQVGESQPGNHTRSEGRGMKAC